MVCASASTMKKSVQPKEFRLAVARFLVIKSSCSNFRINATCVPKTSDFIIVEIVTHTVIKETTVHSLSSLQLP